MPRQIDRDYHVELTATNIQQITQQQATAFKAQAEAASANLRELQTFSKHQAEANTYLESMADDLSAMLGGIERLNDGLNTLNEGVSDLNCTASEILEGQRELTGMLDHHLGEISDRMLQQHKTLLKISHVLARPYETQALELRNKAERCLEDGAKNEGREHDDDWKDAMMLLRKVVENPIGHTDYVSWFQIGFLQWKHEGNLAAAEESFYQAQRKSSRERDLWHVKSLRHLAHMKYLQNKYEDAYQVLQSALKVSADHDTLYDLSRLASKTGRKDEMIAILDKCIEMQPPTIVTMFSEEDFK